MMASVLETVAFSPAIFRQELTAFENLLASKANIGERELLNFFSVRKHLMAYIGAIYLNIPVATEVCPEFDINGNFKADLLVGSKSKSKFCIVEMEPGEEDAIFKKQRKRKNPEWSTRFEHAFSQIVDWFWALEDGKNTSDFRTTFGDGEVSFVSLLVMGRDVDLDPAKRRRMGWRSKSVLIASQNVNCITFDELCQSLKENFEFFQIVAEAETKPATTKPKTKGKKR